MSEWHIGQLVVCINDIEMGNRFIDEIKPVKGQIYTIRDIEIYVSKTGLLLEEIINKPRNYLHPDTLEVEYKEAVYLSCRFRPLRKTSIDVFTAMLNKTPKLVDG